MISQKGMLMVNPYQQPTIQYYRTFIQETFTDPFSENKDLQEPQTNMNAQLKTQDYYKIPNI